MNQVKIGIIGVGRRGRKHLRELVACDFWDDKYVVEDSDEAQKEVVLKTIPVEKAQEGSDMQAVIDGYISIGTIRNTVIR